MQGLKTVLNMKFIKYYIIKYIFNYYYTQLCTEYYCNKYKVYVYQYKLVLYIAFHP